MAAWRIVLSAAAAAVVAQVAAVAGGSMQCAALADQDEKQCRAAGAHGSATRQPAGPDHLLLQLAAAKRGQELSSSGWTLPAFFWNVHWECSHAASGASHSCREKIGHRFAELAAASGAQVVASIELEHHDHRPASLAGYGLSGWKQVDGPCRHGWGGDSAALAFHPDWHIEEQAGGCLRTDGDTRAFAVALVKPPRPVRDCPMLCVVAIHAPHSSITHGKETVRQVCGTAVDHCAIAMGDWNVPAPQVGRLWAQLIGGRTPSPARPDERTCCFPEEHHYGVFDHLASNINGAAHAGHTVHDYQLLGENPVKQHKPVSAMLRLP